MSTGDQLYDVIIVGQGAAAYGAGLYAARYQLHSLIVGEEFGGETATASVLDNYPGQPSIDGYELMRKMKGQVQALRVKVEDDKVVAVRREGDYLVTETGDAIYTGKAVILAVGRERRKLGLAREEELIGRGISFCATCDAPLYRDKVVAVVGGGDAAVKGALLAAKYARKVYVIYRGDSFNRPEPINLQQMARTENIEPLLQTSVLDLQDGGDGLSGVVLDRELNGSRELGLDGLFVEIGADPRVELAEMLGVELNEEREIKVDKLMRTSVYGVFAAGDVTDGSGDLKQTITAVAQGAIAATSAYKCVTDHPNFCELHAVGYRLG